MSQSFLDADASADIERQGRSYLGLSPTTGDTCCAHTPPLTCSGSLFVLLTRLGLIRGVGGRGDGADEAVVMSVTVEVWTVWTVGRGRVCKLGLVFGHGSDGADGVRRLAKLLGDALCDLLAAVTRT